VQGGLGQATTTIDPGAAGLAVDWPATMAAVGEQPLNPITRIASLFGSREVDVVTAVDAAKLDSALAELAPTVNRPAAEGTVRFTGTTPIADDPLPGQELDVPAAAGVLRREWVSGAEVRLPLASIPPMSTAEGVAKAVDLVARPAVASPFTVTGEAGTSLTLTPEQIASVLAFKPGPGGELIGEVNPAALEEVAGRSFAASEQPGRDASIDFATGAPVVVPSQDGRGVDYEATAVAMGPPLISADRRQVAAVYAEKPAELTTEKLKELGITGLVSEFTTRGFAADSGQNIKRAAEQINGTVVQPGATFSLNGLTNPRDASNGYVEAGIIEDGHPSRGIGGGVSQIATTTYNAAYFAGMTLVEHREHSFYISRYPPAREATVFDNIIDLKFRNDSPTAIMIQTVWTPSTITVRFFGTKYYEVTSTTGPRTAPTEPKTVTIPSGEPCSPSSGAPGFTVTDTRTLRDLKTGAVRSDPTRTVRYNPSPIVECGG
jgi:vancomycin resistance protein YoaR